jgi:uncharacterized protein (TIGR00369 family)
MSTDADPELTRRVQRIFSKAAFLDLLGIELLAVGPGWCETGMTVDRRLHQQHGFIHAGVIATLADHTAGGAARSSVGAESDVITVEFKINFLRPAKAVRLVARGAVLRTGRSLVVAESEVFVVGDNGRVLVSKLTSTLAVIPAGRGEGLP